jgi:hypothetical protein
MRTQRTFLIILPLHLATIFSGAEESREAPFAEAYASAIGSVHPIAGISSSPSIDKKSCFIFSLSILLPQYAFILP